MGFFQVAKHHSRAMPDEASVSLARGGSKAAVVLRIRIGREVAGHMGWAVEQRVELDWGHGRDAGRVMLRRSPGRTGVKLRTCGGGESGTL